MAVDHPPVPPPRTKARQKKPPLRPPSARKQSPTSTSLPSGSEGSRHELIHVAEVYSSRSRLLSSSSDEKGETVEVKEKWTGKRKRRKKRKKGEEEDERGRGREGDAIGAETETLSDTDEENEGSIKVGPVAVARRRRLPRGSQTETLSEEEDEVESVVSVSTTPKPPVPLPRRSATTPSPTPAQPPQPKTRIRRQRREQTEEDKEEIEMTQMESNSDSVQPEPLPMEQELSSQSESNLRLKDGNIVCLSIHGCSPNCALRLGSQPVVRVHIVDTETKKHRESRRQKDSMIQPMETHACKSSILQKNIRLQWEEDIIIKEPIENIVSPETIIFFEFIHLEMDKKLKLRTKYTAWAFLKPVASNKALNVDQPLRLQMFKPQKSLPKDNSLPPAYYWWSKGKHKSVKGIFLVTLRSVPEKMVDGTLENPQQEKREEEKQNSSNSEPSSPEKRKAAILEPIVWNRFPTQSCKLPNSEYLSLPSGSDGCLCLSYSHSGLLLACPTEQFIIIYTFKGETYLKLEGQQGLVYSLSWTRDDNLLLSASSDTTACVWNVKNKSIYPSQVLPHPSYVYCCCWLNQETMATGCFDTNIRLWKINQGDPFQYLSRHKGCVNSIVDIDDATLISGDSEGIIILWVKQASGLFEVSKELRLREVVGNVINKLSLHPRGRRILIHTRDNMLRMLDIQSASVIQWYHGGVNTRLRQDSGFCGCGSRIFASSEDCTLCVWESDTGVQEGFYTNVGPAAALVFHPHDNFLAFSSLSPHSYPKLVVLQFDRNESGEDIGLVLFDSSSQMGTSLISSNSPRKPGELTPIKSTMGKVSGGRLGSIHRRKKPGRNSLLPPSPSPMKGEIGSGLGSATDVRLADIIYQMDRILLSASPSGGPR